MATYNPSVRYSIRQINNARSAFESGSSHQEKQALRKRIDRACKAYILLRMPKNAEKVLKAGTSPNGLSAEKRDKMAQIKQELEEKYAPRIEKAKDKNKSVLESARLFALTSLSFFLSIKLFSHFDIFKSSSVPMIRDNVKDVFEATFCAIGGAYFIYLGQCLIDGIRKTAENLGKRYYSQYSNLIAPAIVLIIATALEIEQKYWKGEGTYDPRDIGAYIAGVSLAYAYLRGMFRVILDFSNKPSKGES